jgi:hypothetical protein
MTTRKPRLLKQTTLRVREAFLEALRLRGNISDACRTAGVSKPTVYEWRRDDPTFAAAWAEAIETATDALASEAWRRAVEGVEEPIVGRIGKDQDGVITHVRRYSDSLMALLLRAHRPDVYRERTEVRQTGKIEIEYVNDWRDQPD